MSTTLEFTPKAAVTTHHVEVQRPATSNIEDGQFVLTSFVQRLHNTTAGDFRHWASHVAQDQMKAIPIKEWQFILALSIGVAAMICTMCWCRSFEFQMSEASTYDDEELREGCSSDGAVRYEWIQTPQVATMYLTPPSDITKQTVAIGISPWGFKVGKKGAKPFFKEETFREVDPNKSSWKMLANGVLEINFYKAEDDMWKQMLYERPKSGRTSEKQDFRKSGTFGGH